MKPRLFPYLRRTLLALASVSVVLFSAANADAEAVVIYSLTESVKDTTYNARSGPDREITSSRVRAFIILEKDTGKYRRIDYRVERSGGTVTRTYSGGDVDYEFSRLFDTTGRGKFMVLSFLGTGQVDNCEERGAGAASVRWQTDVETLAGRTSPKTFTARSPDGFSVSFSVDVPGLLRGHGVFEEDYSNTVQGQVSRTYQQRNVSMRLSRKLTNDAVFSDVLFISDLEKGARAVINNFLLPRGFTTDV